MGRRWGRVVAAALGLMCAAAGCGAVGARSGPEGSAVALAAVETPALRETFVTVAGSDGQRVQLRSTTNGTVVRTLVVVPPGESATAVETGAGTVLVAETTECRATLLTVDPATSKVLATTHVDAGVYSPEVSPGGRYLAYLTYPACSGGPLGDASIPLPYVLAVRDLATGATVRTSVPNPGQPWSSLTWSPGGRSLLAAYDGGYRIQLMVLDPAHPDYATGRRIKAPKGCGYLAPAWRASGIVAALDCTFTPGLRPKALVRLSPTGRILASSSLPACIDGFGTQADPGEKATVVEEDIGYGGCGGSPDNRFAVTSGIHLRTLADLGQAAELG